MVRVWQTNTLSTLSPVFACLSLNYRQSLFHIGIPHATYLIALFCCRTHTTGAMLKRKRSVKRERWRRSSERPGVNLKKSPYFLFLLLSSFASYFLRRRRRCRRHRRPCSCLCLSFSLAKPTAITAAAIFMKSSSGLRVLE